MKKLLILFLLLFTTDSFASGISGNVTSAPCDSATLSKYTGTANVEINWEPNTINLNWYDGDTKLTVASSAQSCVYDSTLTVPEQPTKPGYTFNGWKVIRVPGGFTELEYLESSGAQYINTGIRGNQDTKAEIKFVVTSDCHAANAIFGARLQAATRAFTLWAPLSDGYIGAHFAYVRQASTTMFSPNTTYIVELSKNGLIVNNILTTIPQQSVFTTPYDILLFNSNGAASDGGGGVAGAICNSNGSNRALVGKVYYFRLYENNNLVRNFIPARRNSDGVLGMYDTVTDTFFTNAGTGTFIAGPVVQ